VQCVAPDRGKLLPVAETQMAEFEKISVLLPTDLVRSVREAVDGERYAVESDVLIDALQDWEVKQQIRASKLLRLRELIAEGDASGFEPMAPDEIEQIKREGRAILAARKAAE
jgi:antitoxin ParD1/3/4